MCKNTGEGSRQDSVPAGESVHGVGSRQHTEVPLQGQELVEHLQSEVDRLQCQHRAVLLERDALAATVQSQKTTVKAANVAYATARAVVQSLGCRLAEAYVTISAPASISKPRTRAGEFTTRAVKESAMISRATVASINDCGARIEQQLHAHISEALDMPGFTRTHNADKVTPALCRNTEVSCMRVFTFAYVR
jgi:hypothetical protein